MNIFVWGGGEWAEEGAEYFTDRVEGYTTVIVHL